MNVKKRKKLISTLMTILLLMSLFLTGSPVQTQAQEKQYVTVYVGDNVSRLTGANAPKPGFEEHRGDIIPLTKVEYTEGDTAFSVLLKAAKAANKVVDFTGQAGAENVNGIGGLSTLDAGPMSGWMVDVNGPFLNVAASAFPIQPNDYVEWQYSCSWGSDIGADWQAPLSNRIKEIKMIKGSLSPKFDPDNTKYALLGDDKTQFVQLHPVLENGLGKDWSLKKIQIVSQGLSYKSYQSIPVKNNTDILITVGDADDSIVYTLKVIDVNSVIKGLEEWERKSIKSSFDDAGNEIVDPSVYNWATVGLARLGETDDLQAYLAENAKYLAKKDNWNNIKKKVTSIESICLAVGAAKGDPRKFAGKDLIAEIYNYPSVSPKGYPEFSQGINGAVFALIALDSLRYEIPAGAIWSRAKILDAILKNQLTDGGFALTGDVGDPDLTAMAIQSLVPYSNTPEVKLAIDNAVSCLATLQQPDGGYSSKSSESTSQTIIALCTAGINIDTDTRFIKTGNTLLSNLLTFKSEDGGIKHIVSSSSNAVASEQALLALASYVRFKTNRPSLYDYRENNLSTDEVAKVAAKIKSVVAPAVGATSLTMPTIPEGFTISIKSSSNAGVIAIDGTITPPAKASKVNLIFTVTKTSDNTTADTKRISVTVPKKTLAKDVAAGIKTVKVAVGATRLIMPTVPERYTIAIKSSNNSDVINTDGTITSPVKDTKVKLIFTVTKITDPTDTADTKSISVTVPKRKAAASNSLANIMSIANLSSATQLDQIQSEKTVYQIMVNKPSVQERITGVDSYATAVEIAKSHFATGADTVILARGDVSADALPAVPLAKKYNAPLLLTPFDVLPSIVLAEIKELKAKTVIITGGEGAVSKQIADTLSQAGINVQRVFGSDHYGTAYEIAKILGNNDRAVIVSSNYTKSFPDALSISSWAAYNGVPILYADASDSLPQATEQAIAELGIKHTFLVGGTAVLPQTLEKLLPSVQRYSGQNLYETNIEVLSKLQPHPVAVYATTGTSFGDALAISAVAGQSNAWVLLTGSEGLTEGQKQLLESENSKILSFQVLARTMVMPDKVLIQLQQILGKNVSKTDTNEDTSTNEDEDEDTNEDEDSDVDTVKEVVTIAVNCQTAVDNGLHEENKFEKAVPEDGIILKETNIELKKGQTVFDVLKSILAKKKIHMSYQGSKKTAYIQEINHLSELDAGPSSGWMYSVNGVYLDDSCGQYKLKDGDTIQWSYTCDMGEDL